MKIFEEKQRFDQWWLYIIYAVVSVVLIFGIYQMTDGFRNSDNPLLILSFLAAFFIMAFILSLRLETRIDFEGIG